MQLNLFDRSHTDAVYKFVTDFQKDPYTTGMSFFSKIADKLLFRYVFSKFHKLTIKSSNILKLEQ